MDSTGTRSFCGCLTGIYVVIIGTILPGIVSRSPPESYYCSNRLETALEHIVRRTQTNSGGKSYLELSPYSVYHSIYGGENDEPTTTTGVHQLSEKLDLFNEKSLPVTNVEVAELRVRLPQNFRWVHVDRCHFSNANRTLDTRLVFPDLTISGRIFVRPTGTACSMILRLRYAGIEFHTVPLTTNEEARRSGTASVRTDSHFSQPGFLSVFAHGCRKNTEIKFRYNSKITNTEKRRHFYDKTNLSDGEDVVNFMDNIVNSVPENGRTFSHIFGTFNHHRKPLKNVENYQNYDLEDTEEIFSESTQRYLEHIFSVGVRSLLTAYMQKTLQPAIKETLMENMGYTLSYG